MSLFRVCPAASPTPIGQWLQGLMARAHKNAVVVALASKLARIVWAVLRRGGIYNPAAVSAI
jgi:transposase